MFRIYGMIEPPILEGIVGYLKIGYVTLYCSLVNDMYAGFVVLEDFYRAGHHFGPKARTCEQIIIVYYAEAAENIKHTPYTCFYNNGSNGIAYTRFIHVGLRFANIKLNMQYFNRKIRTKFAECRFLLVLIKTAYLNK